MPEVDDVTEACRPNPGRPLAQKLLALRLAHP